MEDFGTYNISTFLPPAAPLRVNINRGWEYVRIINNSPYLLTIDFGSSLKLTFPEMYLEDIKVPGQNSGWIAITPTINLSNIAQAISNTVSVNTFSKGELSSPQAQPLTQQAVNVTGSGKPKFSANADFSSTATATQAMNIFNPANSGTIVTFHQIFVFTNDSTVPGANVLVSAGSDLNYANNVTVVCHTVTALPTFPPVSVVHATQQDAATSLVGTAVEVVRQPTTYRPDVLNFPDDITLYPGTQVSIILNGTGTGHIVHITAKWTETQVVPPVPVTGATAVASSIRNDGNPVGTSIIEATPSGAPQAVQLFNDGTGFYAVDQSGVAHRVFTFNASGNPLQQGQAGDIMEFLGQILVDQLLTAILGITVSGGAISITGNAANSLHLGQSAVGDTLDTAGGVTYLKSSGNIVFQSPNGTAVLTLANTGQITFKAGSTLTAIKGGFNAITTAGTVITHGMGVTPTAVVAISGSGGTQATIIATALGTTTFTLTPSVNCNAFWIAVAN